MVHHGPSQIPAFEQTKASAKFEVATSNRLRDAFTRKYIISLLTLTYAPAKFEAAMSNGLGGNAFTRYMLFEPRSRSHEALPSTSCDLCTCKV